MEVSFVILVSISMKEEARPANQTHKPFNKENIRTHFIIVNI